MTNLFDNLSDLDDGTSSDVVEEPTVTVKREAQAVLDEIEQQEEYEEEISEELKAVEERLEAASYYRLLLNHSLFGDDDNSIAAKKVMTEVRKFVRERLAVLVGLKTATTETRVVAAKPQFEEDEVKALKAVAAKVLKKPEIVAKKEPEIQKVQVTTAAPVPAKMEVVKKPRKPRLGRDVLKTTTPVAKQLPAPASPKPVSEKEIPMGTIRTIEGKRYKRVEHPVTGEPFDMEVSEQVKAPGALPQPNTREAIEGLYSSIAHTAQSSIGNVIDGKTLAAVNLILQENEE